ncbi:MAG: formate dehydrogenase accessory sulfurtransferase FdhD, partial [Dermatophilaceae bacterium]
MGRVTRRTPSYRLDVTDPGAPAMISRPDTLTVEEPLEIRVDGVSLSVTMRTPGNDFDLSLGFLLTEGLIETASDVRTLMHCLDQGEDGLPTYNVVDVTLASGVAPPSTDAARQSYITSSCGICGKASIEAITTKRRYAVEHDRAQVDPRVLA